ncbi:MAG: thrombospondin type 3 repeat-containing protein [Verrucomicrobiota bacterium]
MQTIPTSRLYADRTDSDADGLPDWWETAHAALNPSLGNDADVDTDADGYTNAEELAASTNPRLATSSLGIAEMNSSGDDLRISFSTIIGKRYEVQHSAASPTRAVGADSAEHRRHGQGHLHHCPIRPAPAAGLLPGHCPLSAL